MSALPPCINGNDPSLLLFCSSSALFITFVSHRRLINIPKFTDALLNIDEDEVEKQARYRFTEGRLTKAIGDKKFDVILIGSGPGSMACAASLARV